MKFLNINILFQILLAGTSVWAQVPGTMTYMDDEMKFWDGQHWVGTLQSVTANACVGPGEMTYDVGTQAYLYCDSSDWINIKGASLGSSGAAPAGQLIYDSSTRKYKMSDGTNWYKVYRQTWTIDPAPYFGGYQSSSGGWDTGCITSDTVTMSGITDPIEIDIIGQSWIDRSEYSEDAQDTGTITVLINGVFSQDIYPDDYDGIADAAEPEYGYFYGGYGITLNPGDTLAFAYCGVSFCVGCPNPDHEDYSTNGHLFLEIYNNDDNWQYLDVLEYDVNGS